MTHTGIKYSPSPHGGYVWHAELSAILLCSIVGHCSPLSEDTTELKDGDLVKM